MPKQLLDRIRRRRAGKIDREPIRLGRRRVYILPTRSGVLFGLLVAVMLLGSINYNNNLGLAFTFLLIGLALVTILHTHRNLVGLQIRSGQAPPVFAGGMARFDLHLSAPKPPDRMAIAVQARAHPPVVNAVAATPGTSAIASVSLPAVQRGLLGLGRCKVSTDYPLGLFRAWSSIHPDSQCLVYPRPESGPVPAPPVAVSDATVSRRGHAGREDFLGLRGYRPGDSSRHLAWKQAALGPVPYTKQFEGDAGGDSWLDWDQLPELVPEARLARLCRWVLDSHAAGHRYGLRLPGVCIDMGSGENHKHRCLEAMARLHLPGSRGDSTP